MNSPTTGASGRRVIDGVPSLGFGKGRECTFIGALEAATAPTPTPYRYETMMGWSGLAFRTRWYHPEEGEQWCASSPIGEGAETFSLLRPATGWQLRFNEFFRPEDPSLSGFYPVIASSIEHGKPVLAYGKTWDFGVIIGHEADGETVIFETYDEPEPKPVKLTDLGPMMVFLGEYRDAETPREAALAGLLSGLDQWAKPAPGGSGYRLGKAAFAQWAADLRNAEAVAEAADYRKLFFVNWWCFVSLLDARKAAVAFLRETKPFFDGDAFDAAVLLFVQEVSLLQTTLDQGRLFLGKWTGKGVADWSAEIRAGEAELLDRVAALEAAAFEELAKGVAG